MSAGKCLQKYICDSPSECIIYSDSKVPLTQEKKKEASVPAENIFDQILTMIRWSGDTEKVYHQVLDLMNQDFQTKWSHIKESLVDSNKDKGKGIETLV